MGEPTRVKGMGSHVWVECTCGKIVQRAHFVIDRGLLPAACCKECRKGPPAPDQCPETVYVPDSRGAVRCGDTRNHTGRCS